MHKILEQRKILLVLIILLAFVLRFWRLDSYPALNADEAALGYNAYSLLQTGKDEHGNLWPIHFQSFNDYKPGFYVYLTMPFVAVMGLNEWAVRLQNALLSLLTVWVVYLLLGELFKKNKELVQILGALFIAISPWHIHFSRGGWEVNVATFFITLGVLLFLKGLHSNKYLFVSVVSFVLAFYTYHAARVIIPVLGMGLVIFFWKDLWKNKTVTFVSAVLGLVLLIPLILDLLGPAGISRAAGVGLFADPGPLNRVNELRGEHESYQDESAVVLHNKAVNYGLAFMENWTEHYDGEFLFLSGDVIQRNKVPETGQTYTLFFVLFAIGIFSLLKNFSESGSKIVLLWFGVAPLAAALTFQSPHALRSENMVIPLEIINAVGLAALLVFVNDQVKNKSAKYFLFCLIGVLVVCGFSRYLHMYCVHMSKEYPFSSQYGVKELVKYVESSQNEFEKVLVTDRYDQPYILFLFYMKYPPAKFQSEHQLSPRDQFGFSTVRNFDKYHFWSIDFEAAKRDYRNSLIAGTDSEIPNEANVVKKINGTNDYLYFEVVAN